MLNVTRDVVADLWPIYEAGEATADTRALVEKFLAGDPAFASLLRATPTLDAAPDPVAPEVKLAALKRTRDLVRGNSWLRGLRLAAFVLTIFGFARIISDTSWDVSPRPFIADAVMAVVLWTLYCVLLRRFRTRSLRP